MAISTDNEVHSMAMELINQLGIILRNAQIHSLNNITVTSAINKFVSQVNQLVDIEYTVALELRGEYLYFNDKRIRYAPEYLMNLDSLVRELKKVELGSISIKSRLIPEDIIMFVSSYVSACSLRDPFESIMGKMSGITHIELEKLLPIISDDSFDVKKMVKKTYFSAVSYSKGVFTKIRTGEKINLKRAKRVITSLVNHIMEQEQIMLGMTAIKDYDDYTYYHSTNVSILSVALGQRLGLSRRKLIELGIVSLFHDIGKTEIPYEILNKPEKLNDDEWTVIRQHPKIGVRAILNMRNIDDLTIRACLVCFEHHMNFDHSGYPAVRQPGELDLYSRIISIADQYDAMTASRVYKREPMSPEKAITDMIGRVGKHIDPLLFKFFLNMVGIFPIGTLVLLDSNEFGIVYENNHLYLQRPRVMIITNRNGTLVKGRTIDLTEKNDRNEYTLNIIKTMDPRQYNINLAEFLLQ
ncbi:MAG: HD-GYP domain-containing protein [Nitrospiraceae bacterium]|nr:MAG: HD-GYP domain-containing protein [Nitrospiraceae bacterium]